MTFLTLTVLPSDVSACSTLPPEYTAEPVSEDWEPPILVAPQVVRTRVRSVRNDCSASIEIELLEAVSSDPRRVGYEVAVVSGEPPDRLHPRLPAQLRSFSGTLIIEWFAGVEAEPPFAFEIEVRAIDAIGNQSEPSETALVEFAGDPPGSSFGTSPFEVVEEDQESPGEPVGVGQSSGGGVLWPISLLPLFTLLVARKTATSNLSKD